MAINVHYDEAYVTGWDIRDDSMDFVTHKFSTGTSVFPVWSIAFDAQVLTDFGQAVVAYNNNITEKFPVFVAGGSTEAIASEEDQFTIRYDLTGFGGDTCPECGTKIATTDSHKSQTSAAEGENGVS